MLLSFPFSFHTHTNTHTHTYAHTHKQQDESIEKVIKDTECLFKSREKEYQETIDQIEVSRRITLQGEGNSAVAVSVRDSMPNNRPLKLCLPQIELAM